MAQSHLGVRGDEVDAPPRDDGDDKGQGSNHGLALTPSAARAVLVWISSTLGMEPSGSTW